MKKKLLALGLAVMTVAMSLVGCSEKAVTWTVTCPWAPSGVAAMVSQKAASLSNTYSDKIILVADAVKGDAATVNSWVAETKANDPELVFAGEGLFSITSILDPAKMQFTYDDFEFVENLYSSVFVMSADSKLNIKNIDDLKTYMETGNQISIAANGATGSEAFLAAALFGSMGYGDQIKIVPIALLLRLHRQLQRARQTSQSPTSPRSLKPISRAALPSCARSTVKTLPMVRSQELRVLANTVIHTSETAA